MRKSVRVDRKVTVEEFREIYKLAEVNGMKPDWRCSSYEGMQPYISSSGHLHCTASYEEKISL